MAFALRRGNEIDDDQLSDILDLAYGGKEWVLSEIEDGNWIGLLDEHPDVPDLACNISTAKRW